MGTALVPAPLFVGQAQSTLAIDSDSNGEINPGDTLTYTIVVENVSVLPISDIVISDTVPLYTAYIPGSAHLTGSGILTDTITGTVGSTLFPLDEGGYTIATLLGNDTVTVTFVVTANVLPEGITELVHAPTIDVLDQMLNPSNSTPITATPDFEIEILVDGENPDSSEIHYITAEEPITWTYVVTNTGHVPLTMTNFISSTVPITITGDSNGNGIFDPGEIWVYTEVVTPSSTAPNGSSLSSSTIRGERGDTLITHTLTSTFFAANLFLEIDKTASMDTITTTTGITYTYAITNSGNVTITPFITDDLCAPLTLVAATDLLSDTLLSIGEVWHYQCNMPVNMDLLNTVTVTGTGPADLIIEPITDTAFVDRLPSILFQKSVTPTLRTEPGGAFTYTLTLTNTTPETVTVAILSDTHLLSAACQLAWAGSQIASGATTSCTYSVTHSIPGIYTNTASITVQDDEGNPVSATEHAMAQVMDELPAITLTKIVTPMLRLEPGGLFTYTLTITNTTSETATLTVFTDTHPLSAACQLAWVGSQLPSGATSSCAYSVTHSAAGTYTNTLAVTAQDDEGNLVTDTVQAVAQVADELPTITLTKIVTPALRAEPGGLFTYTLTITNTGSETVTLTVFTDTHPLSAICQLAWVGSQLPGGATSSCTYSVTHSAAGTYTNTASITAQDDEGNQSTANADATAQVGDESPVVSLTKLVTPVEIMEPGGIFTYTLSLTNLAVEAVTVITLTDSHTLSAGCQALIGSVLAVGETVTCGYQVTHTGISSYTNQALVVVADDEGMQGNDSAETTAHVLDEIPTVVLTKMVTPTTLPAPGGIFTYTLVITNTSIGETVNLIELHDTFPVSAECRGLVGTTLDPGLMASCSYTVEHIGVGIHENNATVVVTDDEDNRIEEDNTDDEIPPVEILPTVFVVEKRPSVDRVAEPGEMVTFTVSITNIGSEVITLVTLVDDIYGDLSGRGSCTMGQTMAAGENYSCVFSEFVSGLAGSVHANTVTATAINQDNEFFQSSDSAVITVDDVLPEILVTKIANPGWLPEPGGFVTFTVSIENRSTEVVTMTTLVDSIYDDLNGLGSCTVPQVLPIGQTYHCAWSIEFAGDPGFSEIDVVTAAAHDRTGNVAVDSDDETVLIIDVDSSLEVTKSADRDQVSEPGEPVTFHLVISNTSDADTIVLDAILDSVYGDLTDSNNAALLETDCAAGEMLAVGESTECSFTAMVSGQPGNVHMNRVTIIGTDNDGTTVTDNGSLMIEIIDVPPAVSIFKRASVESVPPPGADVTFAITIANESLVDSILVNTITDTIFGDVTALGNSTCTVPQILAAETSYHCEFVGFVDGADGEAHTNTVTAAILDDDGESLKVGDSEVVAIRGVTEIVASKQASQDRVPEGGEVISFTVTVSNTGSSGNVSLTALDDSIYGDLTQIPDSTCTLPQALAMGAQYSCFFAGLITGDPGDVHENMVTVDAVDSLSETIQVSATAAVDVYDVLSFISVRKSASPSQVPEQGAMVDFVITTKNESLADVVTLEHLIDDIYGDLNVYADGNCEVPQTLQPDSSYTCTITAFVDGDANTLYEDTVVASAVDDDGRSISAQGTVIVEIIDTPGEVVVQMGADKNVVSESGETVQFMVTVQNISPSDVVTLTSVIDSVYGDLTAYPDSTCTMPQVLGVGQQYSCEFPAVISLASGGRNIQTNITTVSAQDDDRRSVSIEGVDGHRIVIADPKVSARKTDTYIDASQDGLVSPGDIIDYTIVVENSGIVTATGVTVEDVLDDHSTFGGVLMSTQGKINQIDTRSVLVEVGDIAPGQQITILLGTAITDAGITASQLSCIENQAGVRGLNILPLFTDDPDSAAPQDATGINCDPTPITLSYFAPIWRIDGAHIQWVTGAEFNTWGFHVWRSLDEYVGNATRITENMIWAGVSGGLYSMVDTQVHNNTDYYYWLEETELGGMTTTMHGPFLLEPDPEIRSTGDVDELMKQYFLPVVWR